MFLEYILMLDCFANFRSKGLKCTKCTQGTFYSSKSFFKIFFQKKSFRDTSSMPLIISISHGILIQEIDEFCEESTLKNRSKVGCRNPSQSPLRNRLL